MRLYQFLSRRWDVMVVIVIVFVAVTYAYEALNLSRYYSYSDIGAIIALFVVVVSAVISVGRRLSRFVKKPTFDYFDETGENE